MAAASRAASHQQPSTRAATTSGVSRPGNQPSQTVAVRPWPPATRRTANWRAARPPGVDEPWAGGPERVRCRLAGRAEGVAHPPGDGRPRRQVPGGGRPRGVADDDVLVIGEAADARLVLGEDSDVEVAHHVEVE